MTHKGSCLCGGIRYEVTGSIGPGLYCHCARCRKAGGSAFAANAAVAATDFHVLQGETLLKRFSTPEGVHRVFCSQCGSPIFSQREHMPGVLRLRLGLLDTSLAQGPEAHIFTASRACWFEIADALPQFPERKPD